MKEWMVFMNLIQGIGFLGINLLLTYQNLVKRRYLCIEFTISYTLIKDM
jgi:hypothetical protein